MNQGIIQTMKLKYRKLQLKKIVTRLWEKDKSVCASQLLKEVDVLEAIYWVKQALDTINRGV